MGVMGARRSKEKAMAKNKRTCWANSNEMEQYNAAMYLTALRRTFTDHYLGIHTKMCGHSLPNLNQFNRAICWSNASGAKKL